MRLAGEEKEETRKISRPGAETVHSSIQLGLHQGYGSGFGGGLGKFACLLDGGNRDREAVLEGKGIFRRQSRSQQKDGLTNSSSAECDPFRCTGDSKFLATGLGQSAGYGNKAMAIGIVFDNGQDSRSFRNNFSERPEVVPKGGKRDLTPYPGVVRNFHGFRIRGKGGGEESKNGSSFWGHRRTEMNRFKGKARFESNLIQIGRGIGGIRTGLFFNPRQIIRSYRQGTA
jgi:hypothetical protein